MSRFIPTCVGNSIPSIQALRGFAVHPHVCGELIMSASPDDLLGGSSPRVWGTQGKEVMDSVRERFIPTCVGNSGMHYVLGSDPSVHPHVCGELEYENPKTGRMEGSSPRVWGTH